MLILGLVGAQQVRTGSGKSAGMRMGGPIRFPISVPGSPLMLLDGPADTVSSPLAMDSSGHWIAEIPTHSTTISVINSHGMSIPPEIIVEQEIGNIGDIGDIVDIGNIGNIGDSPDFFPTQGLFDIHVNHSPIPRLSELFSTLFAGMDMPRESADIDKGVPKACIEEANIHCKRAQNGHERMICLHEGLTKDKLSAACAATFAPRLSPAPVKKSPREEKGEGEKHIHKAKLNPLSKDFVTVQNWAKTPNPKEGGWISTYSILVQHWAKSHFGSAIIISVISLLVICSIGVSIAFYLASSTARDRKNKKLSEKIKGFSSDGQRLEGVTEKLVRDF
ncbi:hypothetical protein AAMO2058_001370400 [Amorphochlora amoebiformis]